MTQLNTENDFYLGFDSADLSPTAAYRLLTHMVAPRPIAFVSTISLTGIPNLAPFSFFMAGGINPPSIAFSPNTNRHAQPKDTLRNIQETGEFVINIVSEGMQERMNITSLEFDREVSEWEKAGFTKAKTAKVRPPRVGESLMAMECKLYQIVSHGQGTNAANYVALPKRNWFFTKKSALIEQFISSKVVSSPFFNLVASSISFIVIFLV